MAVLDSLLTHTDNLTSLGFNFKYLRVFSGSEVSKVGAVDVCKEKRKQQKDRNGPLLGNY